MNKALKVIISLCSVLFLLLVVFFWAVNTGSIELTAKELWDGLFVAYDERVAAVYDLRFPRIIISMLAGAALAVSGVLLQAVLKNPLTDPGIIGITGGASFSAIIISACLPGLLLLTPIVAFFGGVIAFFIVYSLSWKQGLSQMRIVLVGVAVSTMFTGLSNAFNSMSGGNLSGVAAIVNGNITMKTWDDVKIVLYYIPFFLVIALLLANKCNIMLLDDKTARGIGINVDNNRIFISMIAVMLASIATAVVGAISFIGLIVPHIARSLVGTNHKVLLPFSTILGALVFLLADTIGRSVAPPYEISASIIMSVVGGPVFIALLRRKSRYGS